MFRYERMYGVMGIRPLKPCKQIGCPELVTETYCATHKKVSDKQQRNDRPEWQKLYKRKRWIDESKRFLKNNPICIECEKLGELIPAKVVDHIQDHKGNEQLFWGQNNWQSLCHRHHNSKTARQNNFRRW